MNRLIVKGIVIIAVMISGCTPEVKPLTNEGPSVEFPDSRENIQANVGETVEFVALIKAGDRLKYGWYVNDVLESSSAKLEYVFREPGEYTVRFEASNGSGSVSREYRVSVADILKISLSTADSTSIERLQNDYLRVMAIVESGSGVTHEWSVDGTVMSEEAYFGTFMLEEVKTYRVSYVGYNSVGRFEKSFDVLVQERPLELDFSVPQGMISSPEGETVTIEVQVVSGGTGLRHEWKVDGEPYSEEAVFSKAFYGEGPFSISYTGINAKNEIFTAEWTVEISLSGFMLDTFEGISALSPWWRLGENKPGITLVDNPKPSGINTSAKVMSDYVYGTTSTSGYFTLETSKVLSESGIDVSQCNGMRFKIYLGKNRYYPRVDISGTKYAPVSEPQFKDEWEVLEYRFPFNIDPTKIIQIRPLLQQNGSNIPSGDVTETNTRTVYFDDIEFLPAN